MHACYVLHYRCGYVIRTCLKPVLNIIFYHVEFYKLMHRKCVKKQIFYCSCTMPIHTCTCYQSDYQLSPPDWYIQTWSSGTDPPMCMFIQISNSPSQEFLNHGEDFFLSEVQGGWGQFGCVFFVGHLVYVDRWPVLFQWSRWMVFRLCQFFPHLLSILDWYLWTKLSCTPEWFCKQAPECRSLFWDLKINMHIKSYDRNDSVWCLSWIL